MSHRRPIHVSDADMDGGELKSLRIESGMSPKDLGTAVDMDASYVIEMESGTFPITRPAALALRFVLAAKRSRPE